MTLSETDERSVVGDRPSVLFVCVHNACRSQMAAGHLTHLAGGRVQVLSAGSRPAAHGIDKRAEPDPARWDRPRQAAVMPDWLRTAVWIVGMLALLLTLVVGYLMWRYRIPPRGLVAMGGAALYLVAPIDLIPEAILGPLGLVDDAGVVAGVVLFVYKLVEVRRILTDGGVELGRPRRRSPSPSDRP